MAYRLSLLALLGIALPCFFGTEVDARYCELRKYSSVVIQTQYKNGGVFLRVSFFFYKLRKQNITLVVISYEMTTSVGLISTGTRSMIAVCYRIKLYRINIIRDFLYLFYINFSCNVI